MKKRLLIGIVLLALLPAFVSATDYYVDKDSIGGQCNDNDNPGTITRPWCTITKANSELTAGDTVYIRQGIYEENDQSSIIKPRNSGSEGNYITYTNYNDEEVILRSVNDGGQVSAIVIAKNYIKVDNIKVNNIDQSQSNMNVFALFTSGADHSIIQNCEMLYLNSETSYAGIRIYQGSTYNKLLNNTIRYVASDSRDGSGDCIFITHEDRSAQYNLIEGNTAEYCGHSCANIGGQYNIVRNNNFRNPWQKCIDSIITADLTGKSFNVFENNDLHGTETYTGTARIWVHALQMMDSGVIVRRNRIYNTAGKGVSVYAKERRRDQYNKLYHNVVYDTGTRATHNTQRKAIGFTEHDTNGRLDNIDIRNNIFYECPTGDFTYGGFATASDHTDVNNHKNADGDPKFVDGANYDFHLQEDSPAINAGTWLTTTRSAGIGTNLPVEDASYFIDGFGIIEGDLIQLEGQSITARITNVNYDTNTLTVNRSLTWNSGQGVSLAYSGSAPDIGAFEYESGTPPPPPPPPPPPEPIPGDINNDGNVDLDDLIIIASNFGLTTGFDERADTDNNNVIDIFDIVFVASRFT